MHSVKITAQGFDTGLLERGEDNMIEPKFIVDGSDFKELPLRAALYARSLGDGHEEILKKRIKDIEDFIKNETSWDLTIQYADDNCSSKCMCEQLEFRELLEDCSDDNYCRLFDIIVVIDFLQIARNKMIIDFLLDDGILNVPVYCINTGNVIVSSSVDMDEYFPVNDEELSEKCVMRDKEYYA